MNAAEAAAVLAEIARLSELAGENPFRSRAFASAARSLESADVELDALAREGRLTELPGVGAGIADALRELVETGSSALLEDLRAATPAGLYDVLRVPGLGTRKVQLLRAELGIDSLDALESAARDGRLATVSGFGAKTQARILAGIAFVRSTLLRRRLDSARAVAEELCAALRGLPYLHRAEVAGAVRRNAETAAAVELVAAAADPRAALGRVGERLGGAVAGDGATLHRNLSDGLPLRVRCATPERFGAALLWETGSDAHLAELSQLARGRGLLLGVEALRRDREPVPTPDEAAVYAALGLPPIPPELREGAGEIAAAAAGALPRLVELGDLQGTFHCHTVYSDGKATVAEMAAGARSRGWAYLGLADHSRSAAYAGGLSPAAVRKQHREIDAWNRANPGLRLFRGIESDILADGSLDYPDDLLATFDYVVGSVHSGFGMGRREMTKRIVRAVRNPYLTILGHPTGRLLLARDAYAVDVDAVIDAAAEAGAAIELNADPHRLELDWRHLRRATGRGIPIAINPDAHSVAGLDNVRWGVAVGRKGWLEPAHVLNAWPVERVEAYLAERKSRREG